MEFINVIGGVALILFGIRFLRKGLDRLFGRSLVHWLHGLTQNRWKAFLGGMTVSVVAPSSTTQSLLTLQMLKEGRLRSERALAILLGVNVGLTIMVQLLAFQLYDYFAVFLVAGLIGFQFLKREVFRGIGQTLLALGFIFLAMRLISSGARAASGNTDLQTLLEILAAHPIALIIAAALLTILLQSSTASIGMALGLVQGGFGGMELLVPVIVGANLGIAGTALVAGWGSMEGRRMASANLILKGAVAAVMLALLPVLMLFLDGSPGSVLRQGANFHTGFNLLAALIGLPLITPLTRLVEYLIPEPEGAKPHQDQRSTSLSRHSLENPSIALIAASRETMQLVDELRGMLSSFWRTFRGKESRPIHEIRAMDDRIDQVTGEILRYLGKISEEALSEDEVRLQFTLVSFVNELETGGDLIEKGLCDHLVRYWEGNREFTGDEIEPLITLYATLQEHFDQSIGVLATRDPDRAATLLKEKPLFDEQCRRLQRKYFETWRKNDEGRDFEAWEFYAEILSVFRRINSQLTSVVYGFPKEE